MPSTLLPPSSRLVLISSTTRHSSPSNPPRGSVHRLPVLPSDWWWSIYEMEIVFTLPTDATGPAEGSWGKMEMKGKGGHYTPFMLQSHLWAEQESLFFSDTYKSAWRHRRWSLPLFHQFCILAFCIFQYTKWILPGFRDRSLLWSVCLRVESRLR